VSFRKDRGEKMKVAVAKDSQGDKQPSAAQQESQKQSPQEQPRAQQASGQQSGQESGQPEGQTSAGEQSDEQSDEQPDDKEEDSSPPIEVPTGTTAEILKWVGDDKDRAQAALDEEQKADRPRSGLTGELEQMLRS